MKPELLRKLKTVPKDTILGVSISLAIKNNKLDELEKTLRDYYEDNPMGLTQMLGFDLHTYLN